MQLYVVWLLVVIEKGSSSIKEYAMLSGNHKKYDRSPKSIDLDFKNPRLVGYLKREALNSQKDLVIALANHYDVIDLCNNIVNNGYHLDETLIVIPDESDKQNRVTVLEGNRRLAACKILQKPELLKGTPLYSKISRIVKSPSYFLALNTINKINIVEIDGRAEAFAYIASKHTKESIKAWSPYTQGAYYLSFKTPDTTLLEIRNMLKGAVDLATIKHKVLFYRLGEYILNLECWSIDERSELENTIDKLKVEAIIRLLNRKDFQSSVGKINIDDYGSLYCQKLTEQEFNTVLEKLARSAHFTKDDHLSFTLSTRQENNDEIEGYIEECASILNDEERSEGRFYVMPQEYTPNIDDDDELEQQVASRKRPVRKVAMLLNKDKTTFPKSNPKLLSLVEEATKLRLSSHSHTAALLSRAIMEITLKIWIKNKQQEKNLQAKYKNKAFDFASLLSFTEHNSNILIDDDTDAQKAIRSAVQGLLQRDKEILNLTNHNDFHIISMGELREIKNKLELFSQYFFPRLID